MQLEYLRLSYLIYPALPKPDLLCCFHKTRSPSFHSLLSIHSNSNRWHTLTSPSAGSNQTATGFPETRPVCKTQTRSARYSFLSSSYPFLFCHLSTSPHCGNPSQVRTKWVTQGGSQLEHTRPRIRYLLDSAPTWAYGQPRNVLAIWQASRPGELEPWRGVGLFTHAGLNTQDFIKSITARWCSLYVIHMHFHPLPLCNSKEAC